MDPLEDIVLCNNEIASLIEFTTSNSDGNTTYTWINDNTSIGLSSSGNGDMLCELTQLEVQKFSSRCIMWWMASPVVEYVLCAPIQCYIFFLHERAWQCFGLVDAQLYWVLDDGDIRVFLSTFSKRLNDPNFWNQRMSHHNWHNVCYTSFLTTVTRTVISYFHIHISIFFNGGGGGEFFFNDRDANCHFLFPY